MCFMKEIKSCSLQPDLRKLLSYATSENKVQFEYDLYCQSSVHKLYGYYLEDKVIGCIGLEFLEQSRCEIKHIAVSPNHRGKGIGSIMIDFVKDKHFLSFISAETNKDAVNFYKNLGFKIVSLGEKYPGVERFKCILECN